MFLSDFLYTAVNSICLFCPRCGNVYEEIGTNASLWVILNRRRREEIDQISFIPWIWVICWLNSRSIHTRYLLILESSLGNVWAIFVKFETWRTIWIFCRAKLNDPIYITMNLEEIDVPHAASEFNNFSFKQTVKKKKWF